MTVADTLKSARFVVDASGRRSAVLVEIEDWNTLVLALEDVLDTQIAGDALAELQSASGRPERAGWVAWDDARAAWLDDIPAEQ